MEQKPPPPWEWPEARRREVLGHARAGRFSALRSATPPAAVRENLRSEFDVARAEGGLFQLTLHPHVSGHRGPIVVLAKLVEHIKGRPDAWFATHEEVARHCLAAAAAPG